jgi:hypothetical protein
MITRILELEKGATRIKTLPEVFPVISSLPQITAWLFSKLSTLMKLIVSVKTIYVKILEYLRKAV